MAEKPSEEERALLRAEHERLSQEHRDLDAAIEALLHVGTGDRLQIQRLKKRKLDTIVETARTLTDMIDADRATRLEATVVILIVAEILLTIGQIIFWRH